MGPKPFWGTALTGDSPLARELPRDDAEQARRVRVRAPFALMLLLALALAFGFVPALEDRTPRGGSFPLPSSRSDSPQRREVEKERRITAAAAPAVEQRSRVPAGQPHAAAETSPPAGPAAAPPAAAPPAADASPLSKVPEVSGVVDAVVALLPPDLGPATALPAPVGLEAG
jgi:hypothetical protein